MNFQSNTSSFYKHRLNKKISGVCAGIAQGNNLPVWATRLAAVTALVIFPVATLLAYFAAAIVLPAKYH